MTKGYFNGGSGYFINRFGKLESLPSNVPFPGEVTDQDRFDWEKEKFYAGNKAAGGKKPDDIKAADSNTVDINDPSDVTDSSGDGGGNYAKGGPVYKGTGPVSAKFAGGGSVLNSNPSRFAKGR